MLEFAVVRFSLFFGLVAFAALASADTIYLKNGRQIVADHVVIRGQRVVYEIGESSYAIPTSAVERIETGAQPEAAGNSVAPAAPLTLTPGAPPVPAAPMIAGGDELKKKIIRQGTVDAAALAAMEQKASPTEMTAAFFVAGRYEYDRGDRERARFYFERALMFAPENAIVLSHYAAVLVQLGRAGEAVPFAQRATTLAPDSPDAFAVLGTACYGADRAGEAIAAWKRALQLRPDPGVEQYLAKAERERHAEADFAHASTGHFSIRYEGATTSAALRQQIESTLEKHYAALAQELGIQPHSAISVALYTDEAFVDVTQAPAWSGALNDGKLRIPVQGLKAVTPELERVLRHELAHSFINQAAGARCPQWLHEGVAQLLEPRGLDPERGRNLAQAYARHAQIPLNTLEVSFLDFSPVQAVQAYDESLAAAEFIRQKHGLPALRAILERLGEGSTTEMALRTSIHEGYYGLEREVAGWLAEKYGP
jgi:tetratricopeptide (TPR) repeat protein